MLINVRVLVIVALMSYDVYARTAEERNPYKTTRDRKYRGSMLTEIAKELVQRSTTSSQVTETNIIYFIKDICVRHLC